MRLAAFGAKMFVAIREVAMRTYSFLFFHPADPHKFHVKWQLDMDAAFETKSSVYSSDEKGLRADRGSVGGRGRTLEFRARMAGNPLVARLAAPDIFAGWDDCALNVEGPISDIDFSSRLAGGIASTGWRWALIGRWDE